MTPIIVLYHEAQSTYWKKFERCLVLLRRLYGVEFTGISSTQLDFQQLQTSLSAPESYLLVIIQSWELYADLPSWIVTAFQEATSRPGFTVQRICAVSIPKAVNPLGWTAFITPDGFAATNEDAWNDASQGVQKSLLNATLDRLTPTELSALVIVTEYGDAYPDAFHPNYQRSKELLVARCVAGWDAKCGYKVVLPKAMALVALHR